MSPEKRCLSMDGLGRQVRRPNWQRVQRYFEILPPLCGKRSISNLNQIGSVQEGSFIDEMHDVQLAHGLLGVRRVPTHRVMSNNPILQDPFVIPIENRGIPLVVTICLRIHQLVDVIVVHAHKPMFNCLSFAELDGRVAIEWSKKGGLPGPVGYEGEPLSFLPI